MFGDLGDPACRCLGAYRRGCPIHKEPSVVEVSVADREKAQEIYTRHINACINAPAEGKTIKYSDDLTDRIAHALASQREQGAEEYKDRLLEIHLRNCEECHTVDDDTSWEYCGFAFEMDEASIGRGGE